MSKYPRINYIGNKEKIANWIVDNLPIKNGTVVDLFCGGCSVSHALKNRGFSVYCNDILYSNYVIAKALIENDTEQLSVEDLEKSLDVGTVNKYIEQTFFLKNYIYFEDEVYELAKLLALSDNLTGYKRYLLLSLIRRAMIRKIPYSRMNIKWEEIMKLRDEDYSYQKYGRYRHYHNLSFLSHVLTNLGEYNNAVMDGRKSCRAFHMDALDFLVNLDKKVDVVYIDPPYPSTMNDYDSFYGHFDRMLNKSVASHLDLTNKKTFLENFEKVIKACVGKSKYVVISLNNKCYPSVEALASSLSKLLIDYQIATKEHVYKVTGKENKKTNYEILLICKLKESL